MGLPSQLWVINMATNTKGKWEIRLIGNYEFDEVASSLQKMIRRGNEYEACFWGYVIHQSGFGGYLWRRLSIIAREDIGNGDSQASILIESLCSSWERLHKQNKEATLDKLLFPTQAILYMCRCKKTRENDSLVNLLDENWKNKKRLDIPQIAIDPHCEKGRKIWGKFGNLTDGKEKIRIEKWFSEWGHIANKAYEDKWEQEIKEIWLSKAKNL